jgi:ADP-heptose:LPS heptosyltransferase
MNDTKRILIIRPRFLGDIVLATGLAGMLKKNWPQAKVVYLVEKQFVSILESHPWIDEVLSLDIGKKNNPFYTMKLLSDIRSMKFDVILDLFVNPRTAQLSFLSRVPVRIGLNRRGRSWAYTKFAESQHLAQLSKRSVIDDYLGYLYALGISTSLGYSTLIPVTHTARQDALSIINAKRSKALQHLVALAPGASWPSKHWGIHRFIDLAVQLEKNGIQSIFVLGPKDQAEVSQLNQINHPSWIIVNNPSLKILGALIQQAEILISNDAGPMHIGPAVGTTTLGIFGPGNPEIWFPYAVPHQSIHAVVPCSFCGMDFCSLMACMDHITVQQLISKISQILS